MNCLSICRVIGVNYFLFLLVIISWQNWAVKDHICVTHIIQNVIERDCKTLSNTGYNCPDTVIFLVALVRFTSFRKVEMLKKKSSLSVPNILDIMDWRSAALRFNKISLASSFWLSNSMVFLNDKSPNNRLTLIFLWVDKFFLPRIRIAAISPKN